MIDPAGGVAYAASLRTHEAQGQNTPHKRVLRMVKNDRMGGSVPLWEKAVTPQQKTEQVLSEALTGKPDDSFKAVMAYQENAARDITQGGGEFGFGDLLDMVNPLQHIPVVGHIYRAITGDQIRPIGKIIGGALFGGPLGAAGGLINAVIEEETGKDIAGNALALALNGEAPSFRHLPQDPQERLNDAARYAAQQDIYRDLPGSLLAFADLSHDSGVVIERSGSAKSRTPYDVY